MSIFDSLKERIQKKEVKVAVIGLGYVGLPLANAICAKGITTYGIDVDSDKIKKLKSGKSYIDAVQNENVFKWYSQGLLKPETDFSVLKEADFIISCVPTPLKEENIPDLGYVIDTTKEIAKNLRPGHIVVLESTTYPGTSDEVVRPILEESGLIYEKDFHIAYSPERENPGNKDFQTSTIPKIVGADNEQALKLTKLFYEIFIENVVPVNSMAVAEASKIVENVFRSVNIALVNELKVIFDKMGIDVWEVIDAASTKPFGYMPFYPGPGLGGHCIPIDPFYLSWKAEQEGVETRFIELAGEINVSMPNYVLEKTETALKTRLNKDFKDSKVLILGVAYKKNVNDQRETPAFPIISALIEKGTNVDYYDEHIPKIKTNRNFPELTDMNSIDWDNKDLKAYDCVIIVTDHDNIDYSEIVDSGVLVVDTRNVYKNKSFNNLIKA